MTKIGLVGKVAGATGIPVDAAKKAVEAVLDTIRRELIGGGTVDIRGFARFSVVEKKQRMGRNPKTGQPAVIPAHRRVRVRISPMWKRQMDETNF